MFMLKQTKSKKEIFTIFLLNIKNTRKFFLQLFINIIHGGVFVKLLQLLFNLLLFHFYYLNMG